MVWNVSLSKNNVFGVVFPVYVIGRCLGFWPFSVIFDRKHRTSRVKLRVFDYIWFTVTLGIFGTCLGYNIRYDYHSSQTDSLILIVSGRFILIGGFIMSIAALIADMANRKNIWKIITKFFEFDEEV